MAISGKAMEIGPGYAERTAKAAAEGVARKRARLAI